MRESRDSITSGGRASRAPRRDQALWHDSAAFVSWLLLATLSAACLGLYDVSKKAALQGNAVLPVLFFSSLTGSVVVVLGLLLGRLAPETARSLGLVLVPLTPSDHGLVLVKAGIVTTSWMLSFFAIKHLPISIAAPVRASAPLFTLAGAVLLFQEQPTQRQWLGIAAILMAYWAFSVIGRAEGIRFERNRWIALLLAGTVVGAISGLYDKHLLQGAQLPPTTLQCWFTLYNTALQGAVVLLLWRPRRLRTTSLEWRLSIPLVGLLLLVADNLYFRALSQQGSLVSVVSMVRRTNVVVAFLVGAFAFKERLLAPKAGVLVAVLGGLWLLLG